MVVRAPRELRKFGLTVGIAFAVLASISWIRGHTVAPLVLASVALALLLPATVAPTLLRHVERAWSAGAEKLAFVNTRVILTVLFFAVLTPIGFVLCRIRDPLNRSLAKPGESVWTLRKTEPRERYEQQF